MIVTIELDNMREQMFYLPGDSRISARTIYRAFAKPSPLDDPTFFFDSYFNKRARTIVRQSASAISRPIDTRANWMLLYNTPWTTLSFESLRIACTHRGVNITQLLSNYGAWQCTKGKWKPDYEPDGIAVQPYVDQFMRLGFVREIDRHKDGTQSIRAQKQLDFLAGRAAANIASILDMRKRSEAATGHLHANPS